VNARSVPFTTGGEIMLTPDPAWRGLFAFIVAAVTLAAAAYAQEEFPGNKPIELTVLFPAGTSADVTARVLAEGMSRQLNTNIVVVNRPGAGGAIGYKYVAAQTPDGYHIVWNSNSISTTYHAGTLALDYTAFDPVAQVQVETPLLVVKADAPWKALRDFIAQAKTNPGKLTVGNSGAGSHTHFTSVSLFKAAGAEVIDVPFGAAQVIPSLLGGHVQAVVQLPGALASHVKAGTLRVLAALSAKRDLFFPEVPTAQEQGFKVSAELWRGIAVPKGAPKAVIAKLEDAIRKTVTSPEFAKSSERLQVTPAFLPAAEFGKVIAREDAEIAQMMQLLGLKKSAN
jgi:tripartite-type tricarboxylate transporter receptor subunit TctC